MQRVVAVRRVVAVLLPAEVAAAVLLQLPHKLVAVAVQLQVPVQLQLLFQLFP